MLLKKEKFTLKRSHVVNIEDIHYSKHYVNITGQTVRNLIDEKVFITMKKNENYSDYVKKGYCNAFNKYSYTSGKIEAELMYIAQVLDLTSWIYTDTKTEIALFKDVKIVGEKQPKSETTLFLVTENEKKQATKQDIYNYFCENVNKKECIENYKDFFIK